MGPIGFLADFEFSMAVVGVRRGPIGFIAPLSFKWLDSHPVGSNMGPIPIDVHDFRLFHKHCHGFLVRYLPCFGPDRPNVGFSSFSVGTKKNRDEKLRRFVVVSPRGVPSLTVSGPFKIFVVLYFLQAPSICLSQFRVFSVH